MSSEELIYATHGIGASSMIDGIKRQVNVLLFPDGSYQINIITYWPDAEKPVDTKIWLSPDGYRLLTEVLFSGAHQIHKFPLPQPQKQKTKNKKAVKKRINRETGK